MGPLFLFTLRQRPAMWNMFVVLPVIYLVNQIDFTNELNVLILRGLFIIVHCIVGAVVYLLYSRIQAKNDRGTVKTEAGETTVCDYDPGELRQYVTGLGISLLISGFLHYQMGLVPPLAVQGILNPMNLIQHTPELRKRPWAKPSPFSGLIPSEQESTEPE